MNLKVFAVLIVFYCCAIASISSYCLVELPTDPSLRPTFQKKVGSRTAVISNADQFVEIQENEKISAHCDTRFVKPDFVRGRGTTVDLECIGNEINQQYNRMVFECDSLKWKLYESSTQFRWCPSIMMSYLLARPSGSGYDYLAGVCYNFEEMRVISVHYAAAPKFSKYSYPERLRNYTPSIEVENIPINFPSRNITSAMYDNPQFEEWMQFANYQNHSLIQNQDLYRRDSYDKVGGLLDFAWWPGLRLGNWRLYEEALGQHIEASSRAYDVYAGISGTVSAPIYAKNCHKNRTLVELTDRTNRKIPLYVWHYLKSTRNATGDDVIVIAVNSPFSEFYAEKDLVFCNNICHQIDWLQKAHLSFDHKTLGFMFCCTADDVQTSKRLSGFLWTAKAATPKPPPLPILQSEFPYGYLDEPNQEENQTEEIYNSLPVYDTDY